MPSKKPSESKEPPLPLLPLLSLSISMVCALLALVLISRLALLYWQGGAPYVFAWIDHISGQDSAYAGLRFAVWLVVLLAGSLGGWVVWHLRGRQYAIHLELKIEPKQALQVEQRKP